MDTSNNISESNDDIYENHSKLYFLIKEKRINNQKFKIIDMGDYCILCGEGEKYYLISTTSGPKAISNKGGEVGIISHIDTSKNQVTYGGDIYVYDPATGFVDEENDLIGLKEKHIELELGAIDQYVDEYSANSDNKTVDFCGSKVSYVSTIRGLEILNITYNNTLYQVLIEDDEFTFYYNYGDMSSMLEISDGPLHKILTKAYQTANTFPEKTTDKPLGGFDINDITQQLDSILDDTIENDLYNDPTGQFDDIFGEKNN